MLQTKADHHTTGPNSPNCQVAPQQTSRYWPGTDFIPACTACTVYSLTVSGRYRYCTVWYSQFYQYLPVLADTKAVSGRYWYCTVWYSQLYQNAGTNRYKNNTAVTVSGRYRYCTVWYSQFYQYLLVLADTKAVSGRYWYRTVWYSQFYQIAGTSQYKNNTAVTVLGRYRYCTVWYSQFCYLPIDGRATSQSIPASPGISCHHFPSPCAFNRTQIGQLCIKSGQVSSRVS